MSRLEELKEKFNKVGSEINDDVYLDKYKHAFMLETKLTEQRSVMIECMDELDQKEINGIRPYLLNKYLDTYIDMARLNAREQAKFALLYPSLDSKAVIDNLEEHLTNLRQGLQSYINLEIPDSIPNQGLLNENLGMYNIAVFGSHIKLDKNNVKSLAAYLGNSRVHELMAGSGMLTKALHDAGVIIHATDNWDCKYSHSRLNPFYDVEKLDCLDAIRKYGSNTDIFLMCWAPYEDFIDVDIAKTLYEINPNCRLLLIQTECTNSTQIKDHIEDVQDVNAVNFYKNANWDLYYSNHLSEVNIKEVADNYDSLKEEFQKETESRAVYNTREMDLSNSES